MAEPTERELADLIEEIERYLAVVDAFRAEGAEPSWSDRKALLE